MQNDESAGEDRGIVTPLMTESLSQCVLGPTGLTSLASYQLFELGSGESDTLALIRFVKVNRNGQQSHHTATSLCQVMTLNRSALLHNGSSGFQFHTHIKNNFLVVEMCSTGLR